MTVTWAIEIDWAANGEPSDEAGRLISLTTRRGRESGLESDGYTRVSPGYFSLVLDNYDQRYNPYNVSGPLYGYIKPHRVIRIKATYNGVTYPVLTGWVRDIRPQPGRQHVVISGYDGIDWLDSQNVPQLALQSNYAVSAAIKDLIEAAAWPFEDTSGWILGVSQLGVDTYLGSSIIEDNGDELPYFWGDPEKTVWEQIGDIGEAFAGNPFVASDGTFAYNDRSNQGDNVLALTQAEILRDIEMPQPWDELRNDIRITGYPRQATAANTELWKLNYVPLIGAGESLTIWAEHNYEGERCPASSITTPASTTDYTANTLANGTGTDKTAQIAIVKTVYATMTKLVITNNDATGVYLTLCKLRGTGLYAYSGVTVVDTDTTSIGEYGKQTLRIGSVWLQKTNDITNHASYAKDIYADPRKILRIRLVERPAEQLAPDLFNQVDISSSYLEIDDTYTLTYIEHAWQAGGGLVTTWRLEPLVASGWILGVGALGTTTILGW